MIISGFIAVHRYRGPVTNTFATKESECQHNARRELGFLTKQGDMPWHYWRSQDFSTMPAVLEITGFQNDTPRLPDNLTPTCARRVPE